jgi:hypothetical protein
VDYTVPFDHADDDVVFESGEGDGRGVDVIDADRNLPPIPEGRHEFTVVGVKVVSRDEQTGRASEQVWPVFAFNPQTQQFDLEDEYKAPKIEVTYAYNADPRLTTRDWFRLWPQSKTKHDMDLYLHAAKGGSEAAPLSERKPGKSFFYDQVKKYLDAVGIEVPRDGKIPAEAERFGNWREWPDGTPRTVSMVMVPQRERKLDPETGKPLKDASGKDVWGIKMAPNGKPYTGPKMFSHAQTDATRARVGDRQPAAAPIVARPPSRFGLGPQTPAPAVQQTLTPRPDPEPVAAAPRPDAPRRRF